MRILVLGGTSFVGREIVADALREGVEVTLFGRGRTGTELFPEVPRRARAAGMPATPLAGTVADVLAWDRARGEPPLRYELL